MHEDIKIKRCFFLSFSFQILVSILVWRQVLVGKRLGVLSWKLKVLLCNFANYLLFDVMLFFQKRFDFLMYLWLPSLQSLVVLL